MKPQTLYLSEAGLNLLIFNSKKSIAKKFQQWIVEDVIPSIRKNGSYITNIENKEKLDLLNKELDDYKMENIKQKKRIDVLENNQKKVKYPKGGYIYVVQPSELLDTDFFKVGEVEKNLGQRKNVYNTTVPDMEGNINQKHYLLVLLFFA